MAEVLEVAGLRAYYGTALAVEDVSFSVGPSRSR